MHGSPVSAGADSRKDRSRRRAGEASGTADGVEAARERTLDRTLSSVRIRSCRPDPSGPAVQEEQMARMSWFDDEAEHPVVLDRVHKLESFTSALADGVVENKELAAQEQRLVSAMKHLEAELND